MFDDGTEQSSGANDYGCVFVCRSSLPVFTLTDSRCEVLQESVIEQLSEVVQDERKAWFALVALAHHISKLLLVGLTA